MAVKANPAKQKSFVVHIRIRNQEEHPVFWFEDETAVWADPAPFRQWAFRGSRPVSPRTVTHWHCNVMGAVRPDTGFFSGLIVSHGNGKLFQIFLDQLQEYLEPDRKNVMILDNARFHHMKILQWGKLEPVFLPPYSPNLNVIEPLWLRIKHRFFNGWIPKNQDQLDGRTWEALKYFSDSPELVKSICATTTYF